MSRFHVSDDGVPRKCVARKQKCKLSHYSSIEEARVGYEKEMEESTLPSSLDNAPNYSNYSVSGKTFKNIENIPVATVENSAKRTLKSFIKGGYIPKSARLKSLSKSEEGVEASLTGFDDKNIKEFINKKDSKKRTPKSIKTAQKAVLAMASFAMISGLAACGTNNNEPNYNDVSDTSISVSDSVENVKESLDSAKEISLKKNVISWGDHWKVYADGKQVAEIDGEALPVFGDTYVMKDMKGNQVGFETEDFITLKRGADVYDSNSQKTGKIKQSPISVGYRFKIYENDEQVGVSQQNLSVGLSSKIKDMEGNPEYKIEKAVFSVGSKVTVVPLQSKDERQVDSIDAVWNAVIMSEIHDASS